MTEDERATIYDLLSVHAMTIWSDEEEIAEGIGHDYRGWRDLLGHPKAHPGCCRTCGCAASCELGVFFEATIDTVIRELDKLGLLLRLE